MAGNRDGHGIGCAGPRYGPHGLWLTDGPCEVRIAARFAARNLPQRLPYTSLKRSCAQIERQIGGCRMIGHGGENARHLLRHASGIREDFGGWELPAQQQLKRAWFVAQHDSANTAFGCRHQQQSQSARRGSEPDGLVCASVAEACGTHSQIGRRLLVKAAGRRIPGLVNGLGDACSGRREAAPHIGRAQLCLICTRAYAQHAGELSLDGERTALCHPGKIGQGHGMIAVAGKIAAKPGHHRRLAKHAQGSASLTGAVTRGQRSRGIGKKRDIGCSGTPAGAGGPAKYPGAGDGVDEAGTCVPCQHLSPRLGWIEIGLLDACHVKIMNRRRARRYPYLAGKLFCAT